MKGSGLIRVGMAVWVVIFAAGCGGDEGLDLVPGVSRALAQHRARTISDLRYEISLSIPERRSEPIAGRVVVRFELESTQAPVVLDFAQPAERVLSMTANGRVIEPVVANEHIRVATRFLRPGSNTLAIEFLAGEGSLNRNDDYLYTLFVPDRARVAMPLFDQPDLKARFSLELEIPATWEAIANWALRERRIEGERAVLSFEQSDPIATYVLAFAAGRFKVETAERDGRTMRFLHRETDPDKVARNLGPIFDLHAAALRWLEEYTGIEYPFKKFAFVAMPAFQYGGMEHPGAIFYRPRNLFLDESATQNQLLGRASVIAHETAHMWFGNLVTMEWFNDVWMKEVFANFLAAKIVNPSFPEVDHDLRFLLAHYPAAYGIDRTAGANPIRQQLENLNEAGSLYGAIIYQKAPIVMKHLELLMGSEDFRDGLREYLGAHRYGNATWPDLIDVLDARSDEDLHAWSEIWVNEPGRPRLQAVLESNGDTIASLRLRQWDPQGRGRLWNQRVRLLLGYADRPAVKIDVQVKEAETEIAQAAGAPVPEYVLINGAGVAYGNLVLDERSREFLLEHLPEIDAAGVRAAAWMSLWDAMLEGEIAPRRIIDLALRALQAEPDELNVQRVLAFMTDTYWRYLPLSTRQQLAPQIEALLWQQLEAAPQVSLKAAYFGTYRNIAVSPEALGRLERIWAQEDMIAGLPLAENDTTALAQILALRAVPAADQILDRQRERIANPDRRTRFDFVRPALSADPSVRDRFFKSLADAASREHEPWVLTGLRFLHHPLRAQQAERYIRPSLEMLEEIQRTGGIFFPLGWLSATLAGHNTASAADIVRSFLQAHPDLPPRLRGKLLQAADPLFRSAAIVAGTEVPD